MSLEPETLGAGGGEQETREPMLCMWNMRANGAGRLLTGRRALLVPGIDDRENRKSGESEKGSRRPVEEACQHVRVTSGRYALRSFP